MISAKPDFLPGFDFNPKSVSDAAHRSDPHSKDSNSHRPSCLLRIRPDEKGRCSFGTAAFAQRFCSELLPFRASAENPVLSQATAVISYPVGRPPLFAVTIPNAALI